MYDSLTLEEKDKELDRQMVAIAQGGTPAWVCPFCGSINHAEDEDVCCAELYSAKERRGVRNIKSIEEQRNAVIGGLLSAIDCPYCGGVNQPRVEVLHPSEWVRPMASPYCCDLFQAAITAVMYAVIEQRRVDHFKRIQDGMERAAKN